jgi:phytoene synthase
MKRDEARASIQQHSKSFALAARLLPPEVQHGAVVLYAYCRRADDAIDLSAPGEQLGKLASLRTELANVYAQVPQSDPLLREFQRVTHAYAVPREYLDELLLGMEMDVKRVEYKVLPDLMLYAYRVAGVVGLMMCHVMGVREASALRHAAHLGMAMQLTNNARDVREDWERGRLYLPQDLLAECGVFGLRPEPGAALPPSAAGGLGLATERLLQHADAFYRSGDAGLPQLSLRCALAIRAARLVYSEISVRVRAQACDPLAPRAVVSRERKLALVGRAAWLTAAELPSFWARPAPRTPAESVSDPESFFSAGG